MQYLFKIVTKQLVNQRLMYYCWCWILLVITSCGVSKSLKDRPDLSNFNQQIKNRVELTDTFYTLGHNQLKKNDWAIWELYVKGDPLERGHSIGSLTQELMAKQERVFFSKIEELVPSEKRQRFLRKFLAWYNRKLYQHIPNEYKAEIYGLSRYLSDDYDFVADNYLRNLYLHGAHDIGHALQDLALVGCSSFAAWGDKSVDGSLIIGRNFDFYAGDEFAEEKVIAFVDPTEGHRFISITWAGMIGVLSGMNEHGLTVTINAGKSSIPLIAKTPIAILNREILQYATNIEEAIAIAKKREVFVSESILIGSAADGKAITIEMSPKKFGVYEVPNANQLVCSNHFQSQVYSKDKKNKKQIIESHSQYRFERLTELLAETPKVDPQRAAEILRNREGLENEKIGYGNEKALNQLLAHHAVIFKPEQRQMWVSSAPYQLGAFIAYDLNEAFEKFAKQDRKQPISEPALLIPADSFLYTKAYENYELFRTLRAELLQKMDQEVIVSETELATFKATNPNYWEVYYLVGKYYFERQQYAAALAEFNLAQTKEVTTLVDRESIEQYIKKAKRKAK